MPYADQGLSKIPDTVLIIGAGPTGICTLQCVRLKNPKRIIVCDIDENRLTFVAQHYPGILTVTPEYVGAFVREHSDHGGVDGCNCAETLRLIEEGKIDTTPLITHTFALKDIEEAYRIFENRLDGVIKVAICQ